MRAFVKKTDVIIMALNNALAERFANIPTIRACSILHRLEIQIAYLPTNDLV